MCCQPKRYEEQQEKAKTDIQSAVMVSLTADMWTFVNMEAYLAGIGHYISSLVSELQHFPQNYTAENMAHVKKGP